MINNPANLVEFICSVFLLTDSLGTLGVVFLQLEFYLPKKKYYAQLKGFK